MQITRTWPRHQHVGEGRQPELAGPGTCAHAAHFSLPARPPAPRIAAGRRSSRAVGTVSAQTITAISRKVGRHPQAVTEALVMTGITSVPIPMPMVATPRARPSLSRNHSATAVLEGTSPSRCRLSRRDPEEEGEGASACITSRATSPAGHRAPAARAHLCPYVPPPAHQCAPAAYMRYAQVKAGALPLSPPSWMSVKHVFG